MWRWPGEPKGSAPEGSPGRVDHRQRGECRVNGTLSANNANGSITVTGTGMGISLQGAVPGVGSYSPTPLGNQPPIADPLASLTMPDYSALVVKTHSCTDGPGIYVSLESCTGGMLPGLYVLTGSTGGNIGIVAHGGTLDLVCSTLGVPRACNVGESGGSLGFSGGGYLDITAPGAGQLNQGLAISQTGTTQPRSPSAATELPTAARSTPPAGPWHTTATAVSGPTRSSTSATSPSPETPPHSCPATPKQPTSPSPPRAYTSHSEELALTGCVQLDECAEGRVLSSNSNGVGHARRSLRPGTNMVCYVP